MSYKRKRINCAYCGGVKENRREKYCSLKCKKTAFKERMGMFPVAKVCPRCGVVWVDNRDKTGKQVYCSIECGREHYREEKKRFKKKICKNCGVEFESQNNSAFCSQKCSIPHRSKQWDKKREKYVCKKCGKTFIRRKYSIRGEPIYCSRECAGVGVVGKRKTYRSPSSGSAYMRAKYYGVGYEPVHRMKVFKRDGWICQICGKRTNRKKMGTKSPDAPEIDHRIPMANGGGHLYSNVQCACCKCNNKKSNKNSLGQLPLFGVGSYQEIRKEI